ncbi:hypothetical protein AK830_g404 [Neonectria ditissima]|uniref:Xylanolytic transcriptional activator regulatory domain-containing protein n=1 Tax=Neonectria ditissima TaxID=78410 RepID=A0A0P7BQ17_9HYPO|nr:hypothetical protein AK830_g404 [Neonectria ditissima]
MIEEKPPYSEDVLKDLRNVHAALSSIVNTLNLPKLSPLLSCTTDADEDLRITRCPNEAQSSLPLSPLEGVPTFDESPGTTTLHYEGLSDVPIHSLYTLTKMSALQPSKSVTSTQPDQEIDDFIARGSLSLVDAEQLFTLYRDKLDSHMYGIGFRYQTLDTLRRNSPILAAASLTVAALHDPKVDGAYKVCKAEFRRLTERTMFNRCVDQDCLRALCIASYWLIDLSWMTSGYTIRRAVECNLHSSQNRFAKEQSPEVADSTRLWYLLFICDQQLATVYRRPTMIREIQGWEAFLESDFTTEQDRGLIANAALMNILNNIREVFGSIDSSLINGTNDGQKSYPVTMPPEQLVNLILLTLDEQVPPVQSSTYAEMLLYLNLAQLYLYSHIFQHASDDCVIPLHSHHYASKAVLAASTAIDLLTTDDNFAASMAGMPSYTYSMVAFACMLLIKVAVQYGDQLVEKSKVYTLVSSMARYLKAESVGIWHLSHQMAEGLERALSKLQTTSPLQSPPVQDQSTDQADSHDAFYTPEFLYIESLLDHDLYSGVSPEFLFDMGLSKDAPLAF